jgi:DNA-binding MltR family transcriptional regulator
MIENRLHRAMLAKFRRDAPTEAKLFRPSGPLGSFSVKIDLAFLLGMIGPEARDDLVILKDIRNRFAHDLNVKDFLSRAIKDKAANFTLLESYVAETDPSQAAPSASLDLTAKPVIFAKHVSERKKQAKDRYLMTAQLMTIRFAMCDDAQCPWPLI